jgi:hypothetical protein
MSSYSERNDIRRRFYAARDAGMSPEVAAKHAQQPSETDAVEEEQDMRLERGTPAHQAYWEARKSGKTTRQAFAAAEAVQRSSVAEMAVTERQGAAPAVVAATVIDIADDWRDMIYPRLRALAAKVSPVPVRTRIDCERAIENELIRRAQQD